MTLKATMTKQFDSDHAKLMPYIPQKASAYYPGFQNWGRVKSEERSDWGGSRDPKKPKHIHKYMHLKIASHKYYPNCRFK